MVLQGEKVMEKVRPKLVSVKLDLTTKDLFK